MSRGAPTHPAVGLHTPEPLLDLCTGQNRFGPPAALLDAVDEAIRGSQPHKVAEDARSALAHRFEVSADQVVLGPGANGLAFSVASALAQPGSTWLCVEPSVTAFAQAARGAGARVTQWRAVERRQHRVELDQVAELARLVQAQVISLSAPADPSGSSVPFVELCALAEQLPDVQVVVDQSWLGLSLDHAELGLPAPANMIRLRSLSVELGLTGLRAGYLLAAPALARQIATAQPPLAASTAAAAALTAATSARGHLDRCRSELQSDSQRLKALLTELELTYSPSVTPFALVRIARAQEVTEELRAQHQLAVYDATRVGLPDHIRIAAPGPNALEQLKTALVQVLERRGLVRGREVPFR